MNLIETLKHEIALREDAIQYATKDREAKQAQIQAHVAKSAPSADYLLAVGADLKRLEDKVTEKGRELAIFQYLLRQAEADAAQ